MISLKKSAGIAVLLGTLGAGSIGIASTFAAENTNHRFGMDGLIEALAEKFNVSTEDVQAVFDEHRKTMHEEMIARAQEAIEEAVAEGELTQAQADALFTHKEDMRAFRESIENMNEEERENAIKEQKQKNKAWKEEYNIPEKFLREKAPQRDEIPNKQTPPENI